MTLKEQIMKLQTYKMYEGEDTVYVERDDVLKALEQQLNYLKKRDGNYVHYNVEWLLKNWQMELDILSDGNIKPCEDCISRQAVLDIINFEDEWLFDANGHNANTKIAFSGLESRVKALPSVTPKTEWIPVSEKLPENYQIVLMTIRRMSERYNHEPFISVGYISWNQSAWWCAHDGDCKSNDIRVDAWMPLPEPYKGESEEEE